MKKLTIVIRYEDHEKQPSFSANMDCLGGIVDAVMFDDAIEEIESLEEEIADLKRLSWE